MTPTTKEAQRAELHKTIWRIANDLRGSVDGWEFKSYVLGMLFYRFISENLTAYINKGEHEAGQAEFDYARLPDAEAEFGPKETVAEKGFYVLPSELFQNVRKRAPKDESLNETLERVFKNIEGSAVGTDSEDDRKGLFDDLDVNSSKLDNTVAKRNEKLVKLLDAIGDLPLGNFEDNSIDLFGDAYEYLVQKYRSQHGDGEGKEIRAEISRAVDASPTLRNKKDLIEAFVDSVSVDGEIDEEWQAFIAAKREAELEAIIEDERLRADATRAFIEIALRDGALRTTGTAITKVLPPASRFAADGGHGETKQREIEKLGTFFERFFGLSANGGSE